MKIKLNGSTSPVQAPAETPPPPLPPQMNAPVGPPPPHPELPMDYEGFMELAKKVSRGTMTDKAQLWVGMALADALNRLADGVWELVGALHPTEIELPNGDTEEAQSVLSDAIADGLILASEATVKNGTKKKMVPKT